VLDFTLFLPFSPRSISPQLSNLGTSEPSNIHPSRTFLARSLARSVAHNGPQKSLQNTLWHTKTRSFFQIIFSGPNLQCASFAHPFGAAALTQIKIENQKLEMLISCPCIGDYRALSAFNVRSISIFVAPALPRISWPVRPGLPIFC